jgi:hypothetical protein
MPGILPMKVIKVGSNCQARIAQACDRCRSKKIRCDGIRPSCTQSLEERVRLLESEVRELKDLLDEKDEKIDMLSRIHSHSPNPHVATRRPSIHSPVSAEAREESQEKDDTFKVQQSPLLLDDVNHDSYFAGSSSGRTLVGMFLPSIVPKPYLTRYRGIQAKGPRNRQTLCRCQLECLLWGWRCQKNYWPKAHCLFQGAPTSCF